MKLKRLKIEGLHNEYDYDITFNEQLTFLYGSNGCGKTTILNILTSIVTGELYKLFNYQFSKIILEYNFWDEEKIEINKGANEMVIFFKGKSYMIANFDYYVERGHRYHEDKDKRFFLEHKFAREINDMFNYIFLPLDRNNVNLRRNRAERQEYLSRDIYDNYLNNAMNDMSYEIMEKCSIINSSENILNQRFRDTVLNLSLVSSTEIQIVDLLNEMRNLNLKELNTLKDEYLKLLNDIEVREDVINETNKFFDVFFKRFEHYSNKRSDQGIMLDFVLLYVELFKIKKIANESKKLELRKMKIRQPKTIFLEILNDFFASSGKTIKLLQTGDISFEFEHSKNKKNFSVINLSSGEKQILITFAKLIFGLQQKKGIFIVDEPESSLHLEWQSKYVSSILKANKNIQLILATHSPEIIGPYRKYAVRVEKTHSHHGEKNGRYY